MKTPLWAIGFQIAASAEDYRAARCILDNQLAGYPSLDWQRYVTAEQAAAIESTVIVVSIAPEPFQSVKPKSKRKQQGDDHIITISSGNHKIVMTGSELKAAGQAIRQSTRKQKRGA